MKYLNIILSNKSVFPCCTWAENSDVLTKKNLVEGIEFAITNKLVINVFYPEENISEDIQNLLSTVSHNRIIPNSLKCQKGDIVIIDGWNHFLSINFLPDVTYIVKTTRQDLSENWKHLPFYKNIRIDIKVIDIEGMKDDDFAKYHTVLANMAEAMVDAYATGVFMQCNLLTDRVSLTSMRNCGAGDTPHRTP